MNTFYRSRPEEQEREKRIPLYLPLEKNQLTGSTQSDKHIDRRGSTEVDYRV